MASQYIYGVAVFMFQHHIVEKKEIHTQYSLFGNAKTKERIVEKSVRETNDHIWTRINEKISLNQWDVINFETVMSSPITVGFSSLVDFDITNNDNHVIGYRVFYKTHIKVQNKD